MKHFTFFIVVFLIGAAFGRYSATKDSVSSVHNLAVLDKDQVLKEDIDKKRIESLSRLSGKKLSPTKLSKNLYDFKKNDKDKFLRKEKDRLEYQMQRLYKDLSSSLRNNDVEEQNRVFDEMLSLDNQHESVFKAKVLFLKEDGDWKGAGQILKECVNLMPESLYCHKNLANIRSSSLDDKIFHGFECLKLSENDPICLVDLAISLRLRGDYETSVNLFERSLSLGNSNDGFSKKYILLQYGITLQEMQKTKRAVEIFTKACKMNEKAACLRLEEIS